ncbi:MAG: hypothetical protein H0W83_02340 [Planctomycetes bacterium]|nr:hypothetical protein [Planctomycetota bacterium]
MNANYLLSLALLVAFTLPGAAETIQKEVTVPPPNFGEVDFGTVCPGDVLILIVRSPCGITSAAASGGGFTGGIEGNFAKFTAMISDTDSGVHMGNFMGTYRPCPGDGPPVIPNWEGASKADVESVAILSADICEDQIKTHICGPGQVLLQVIGAGGPVTLINERRIRGNFTDSFKPKALAEGIYTQIKLTWTPDSGSPIVKTKDYKFENLGLYRHSQYNRPDESDPTCAGDPVDVCFTTAACKYTHGTLTSTFRSFLDLNGSGTTPDHGMVQPEAFCITKKNLQKFPPPPECVGDPTYRGNTQPKTKCEGVATGSTVAVGDNGKLKCGDTICIDPGGSKLHKTVNDRCPACTGKKQIDNFTTAGTCGNINDLGNFVTIKLLQ